MSRGRVFARWNALRKAAAACLMVAAATLAGVPQARAAERVVPCPPDRVRVVRSAGGVIDNLGSVPDVPQLCRQVRANGSGNYYFGIWRDDWPGAGQALPAITAVLTQGPGASASFVTRAVPGLQWIDSYRHEGFEPLDVAGRTYRVVRLAHEREGIEGNTYHSVITLWIDTASGLLLKAVEHQISGQSYGPDATWTALRIEPLP